MALVRASCRFNVWPFKWNKWCITYTVRRHRVRSKIYYFISFYRSISQSEATVLNTSCWLFSSVAKLSLLSSATRVLWRKQKGSILQCDRLLRMHSSSLHLCSLLLQAILPSWGECQAGKVTLLYRTFNNLTKYRQTGETRSTACFMAYGASKSLYFWKTSWGLVQQPQRTFHEELSSTSKEYLKPSHFQHWYCFWWVCVGFYSISWMKRYYDLFLCIILQHTWIFLCECMCTCPLFEFILKFLKAHLMTVSVYLQYSL